MFKKYAKSSILAFVFHAKYRVGLGDTITLGSDLISCNTTANTSANDVRGASSEWSNQEKAFKRILLQPQQHSGIERSC